MNIYYYVIFYFQSDAKAIYLNITTYEDKKLTVELSSCGFCILSREKHDSMDEVSNKLNEKKDLCEQNQVYFETPYSLLSSVSEKYNNSFSEALSSKLKDLQN